MKDFFSSEIHVDSYLCNSLIQLKQAIHNQSVLLLSWSDVFVQLIRFWTGNELKQKIPKTLSIFRALGNDLLVGTFMYPIQL